MFETKYNLMIYSSASKSFKNPFLVWDVISVPEWIA